jgi:hypothetical protein
MENQEKTLLLRTINKLPGPERIKKILHEIMIIIAYLLLILDYIIKNPPPFLPH